MRIDKFLSNLKYGTRSEIKKLIRNKLILLNDELVTNDSIKINVNKDIVKVNNIVVYYKEVVNLMINKPKGYLSANKDDLHKTVIDLLEEPYNRFDFKIAGRLDLDSYGLLILTTNGKLVHEVTNPNSKVEKVYKIKLINEVKDYSVLLDGIIIKDGRNNDYLAKALKIDLIDDYNLFITINEGKFHQVKRMFEYLDNEVVDLKRVKIGKLELKYLPLGKYIEIERDDIL